MARRLVSTGLLFHQADPYIIITTSPLQRHSLPSASYSSSPFFHVSVGEAPSWPSRLLPFSGLRRSRLFTKFEAITAWALPSRSTTRLFLASWSHYLQSVFTSSPGKKLYRYFRVASRALQLRVGVWVLWTIPSSSSSVLYSFPACDLFLLSASYTLFLLSPFSDVTASDLGIEGISVGICFWMTNFFIL